MTNKSLLIKNAFLVFPDSVKKGDIFCADGKIKNILEIPKETKPDKIIDAKGLTVLPGIIDPHVHFELKLAEGKYTSDNFFTGSKAAALGGITTIIDFTQQDPGIPLKKGLKESLRKAENKTHTDYSFHCVIPSWKKLKEPEKQIKEMTKEGIVTFKMFMAYEARGLMSDDKDLLEAFSAAKKAGALISLHAESGKIIDYLADKYRKQKKLGIMAHYYSRPDYTEWTAVQRAVLLAKIQKAPVYFVHISSGKSASLINAAERNGAIGETCPQYLILDYTSLKKKNGHFFGICPPLRTKKDSLILWRLLKKGGIKVIATDNCTFSSKQKNEWKGDIGKLFMGMPGTGTLLPLIYTFGVKKKRISLNLMTKLLSENPAKIMGLYPKKGAIKKGSDADFAIIDPLKKTKADFKKLGHNTDWSPYQGMALYGFPKYTILRGEIIAQDDRIVSKPLGKFIKRKKPII